MDNVSVLNARHILEGVGDLLVLAEVFYLVAVSIMIISSSFYLRHLDKGKKQKKLSTFETIIFYGLQLAYILLGISIWINIFVD